MAEAKEDAPPPPTKSRLIPDVIASTALAIISPSSQPQLLPVSNAAATSRPIAQNLQSLELGKFALTLAITAALGLLFSQKFEAAEAHPLVVVGLMAGVLNGILIGKKCLELLGTSLILLCFSLLVGSFLPLRFSWLCWLAAALSLVPFLCLLLESRRVEG